jgi:hypothetical protein
MQLRNDSLRQNVISRTSELYKFAERMRNISVTEENEENVQEDDEVKKE